MIHVVIALILNNDQVCVGKRQTEPFKGYVECPGGKVEGQESLMDALRRELLEEGDATLKHASYMTHYDVSNKHGDYRLHWFKVSISSEFKPIIYTSIEWVRLNDLTSLDWIPHNRPYLPMIQAIHDYQTEHVLVLNPLDSDEKNIQSLDAYFKKEFVLKDAVLREELANFSPQLQTLIRFYPIQLEP